MLLEEQFPHSIDGVVRQYRRSTRKDLARHIFLREFAQPHR